MKLPELTGRRWCMLAAVVFVSALLFRFGGVWAEGPTRFVPETEMRGMKRPQPGDHIFTTWLVGRNARALATSPWSYFEAEPCYPVEKPIALGENGVALGVLGIPGYLLSRDPVATYNVAIALSILAACVAVGWLVYGWTGIPAAAIAAGLFYGFANQRIADLAHWFILENVWTAFALLFVERALARGRWQDTLLAGASCALQFGNSLYSVIAALAIALPMVPWLVLRHGVRKLKPWAVTCALAIVLGGAYAIYAPYLDLQSGGELASRPAQGYIGWVWLLPSGRTFPGYVPALLLVAGLVLGRRRIFPPEAGDPRVPLVIAAAIVMWLASGGTGAEGFIAAEDLSGAYRFVTGLIPGFDVVRVPGAIHSGLLLISPILAGLGVAGLVRLAPAERRTAAQLFVVGVVWLAVVIGPQFGRFAGLRFRTLEMAPSAQMLEALGRVEKKGGRGPIFELPMDFGTLRWALIENPERVLLSDYHRWRTSSCYNSFFTEDAQVARDLAERVPEAAALAELDRLGYETIIVHQRTVDYASLNLRNCMSQLARIKGTGLRTLVHSPILSAFALEGPFRDPPRPPPACLRGKRARARLGAQPGPGASAEDAASDLD